MIWDNNSNQIVVLNSDETENCDPYWLPVGECLRFDNFTVTLKEETFDMDFVLRDFQLESIGDDFEFNCRMISASYWPDSCSPVNTSFDLINKVKYYRSQSNTNTNNSFIAAPAPIVVHDLYGGHRAATFCALFTFQDLIQLENSVNVYEIAKMFHLKRPEIWNSRTNIMFLYEAVECLFEEMHLNNNNNNQYQINKIFNIDNPSNNNNIQTMNTLPNIPNFLMNQQLHNNNSLEQQQQRNNSIDARIQNFHKQRQNTAESANTDPLSVVPLTTKTNQNSKHIDQMNCMLLNNQSPIVNDLEAIVIDTTSTTTTPTTTTTTTATTTTPFNKPSFIDIPKMLPFFSKTTNEFNSSESNMTSARKSFIKHFNRRFSGYSSTKHNTSSLTTNGIHHQNSRAIKFMNTVMTKSASFKRALFSQSNTSNESSNINQELEDNNINNKNQLDPKPSMMIALASASSSSSGSSSSTTTVVQTTTESSLSSKSAHLVQSSSCSVSPNSVTNQDKTSGNHSPTSLIKTPTTTTNSN
jgi:hypothetical protein